MIASLLVASLLAGAADDLVPTTVQALSLKVPAAWTHQQNADSHNYKSPSEDGEFELSVYPITPRDAHLCLSQLLKALGEKGWERISVGSNPAARNISTDNSKQQEGDFQTRTYLGCNGSTKWVLTFSMKADKKDRYAALAEKIVKSVEYAKPGRK